MDYKKELEKHFSDLKVITNIRYEVAKNMFMYFSLIFFLNYFFVGAKFYDSIFLYTLPFSYYTFIITLCLFLFFYFKNTFDLKFIYNIIIAILLGVIGLLSLFPFSGINL